MESLKGYDDWKCTEPFDPYLEDPQAEPDPQNDSEILRARFGCKTCGKDCRRWDCDTCGKRCKSPAGCDEDLFCSPGCASADGDRYDGDDPPY